MSFKARGVGSAQLSRSQWYTLTLRSSGAQSSPACKDDLLIFDLAPLFSPFVLAKNHTYVEQGRSLGRPYSKHTFTKHPVRRLPFSLTTLGTAFGWIRLIEEG